MRGLLVFFGFIALLLIMMPFILSVVGILVLFAIIFLFLARLGLIPGMTYRRHIYTTTSRKPPTPRQPQTGTFRFEDEEMPQSDDDGWIQSEQEGEIITLPETALKKDDEEPPSSS